MGFRPLTEQESDGIGASLKKASRVAEPERAPAAPKQEVAPQVAEDVAAQAEQPDETQAADSPVPAAKSSPFKKKGG